MDGPRLHQYGRVSILCVHYMYRSAHNGCDGKTRIGNLRIARSETCLSEGRTFGIGTERSKQFFESTPYGFLRDVLRTWGIQA